MPGARDAKRELRQREAEARQEVPGGLVVQPHEVSNLARSFLVVGFHSNDLGRASQVRGPPLVLVIEAGRVLAVPRQPQIEDLRPEGPEGRRLAPAGNSEDVLTLVDSVAHNRVRLARGKAAEPPRDRERGRRG